MDLNKRIFMEEENKHKYNIHFKVKLISPNEYESEEYDEIKQKVFDSKDDALNAAFEIEDNYYWMIYEVYSTKKTTF